MLVAFISLSAYNWSVSSLLDVKPEEIDMKICPRCQRTYTDDNLNFCLEDGAALQKGVGNESPETVLMSRPQPTAPATVAATQSAQPAWNTSPQPFQPTTKKKSKTWLWVLLVLGIALLTCGGGGVAFLLYVASTVENEVATNGSKANSNSKTVALANNNKTSSSNADADDRSVVQDVDLSDWVKDFSVYGTTEFTNGELIMASKQKKFYYVLVAPDDFTTEGANTSVVLRNIDNADSSLGYGLIVHSNPSPLIQDYAFLVDTKKNRYRIVHHVPGDEKAIVPWTNSSAIKEGGQENSLEARDQAKGIEFYINGQLVNTVPNTFGYKNGVPGLYSGDAAKIAFKKLQIKK